MFDSPGDDFFFSSRGVSDPELDKHGALGGDGFYNRAKFFEVIEAYSLEGGYDTAQLYGSGQDNTLDAEAGRVRLFGEDGTFE